MLPFGVAGQFNPLVIQPQAMTQQATRHARRVYVGGLPPSANEPGGKPGRGVKAEDGIYGHLRWEGVRVRACSRTTGRPGFS
jgi:hypothetical protein